MYLMRTLLTSAIIASVACLASTPQWAAAQRTVEKPFKIRGEGVGPNGLPLPGQPARPHWVIGNATHLGLHYGEGALQTDSADPVFDTDGNLIGFDGEFGSAAPFVFCGANGDKLVTNYGRTDLGAEQPGIFLLNVVDVLPNSALVVEALWIAEFVVDGEASTGKFAGASGSWTMFAYSEPFVLGSDDPVDYRWEGEGRLLFQK